MSFWPPRRKRDDPTNFRYAMVRLFLSAALGTRSTSAPSNGTSESADARIQRHSLSVGASARVSEWRLKRLRTEVMQGARSCFERGLNEAALDGFAHCLAIERSLRWRDYSFTCAVEHNVGMCLHFGGHFAAAEAWYESAFTTLSSKYALPTSRAPPHTATHRHTPPHTATLASHAQTLATRRAPPTAHAQPAELSEQPARW
jgi:hypothetical protein